ncbi:DUF4097 and DUF4098 domain-containing protein YvlB [Paenibacillus sp. DS2015]|uniref:DUF4097 family beta strand repeat-containing protein n=1 Tax=Paenibacillus sp. DS2015 TaxID=3373917 RepID=UPI003D25B5D3
MNSKRKIQVGRYTATLLLIITGILLLTDNIRGTDYTLLLLTWWPLLIVMWGIESILLYVFARDRERASGSRFRLDIRGLSLSVILTASVFIVTHQEHYLHLWNKVSLNLTAAAVDYSEQKGAHFSKEKVIIPVSLNSQDIVIENINGDIWLHQEPIDEVQISTEVWVDQITGPEAEAIFEESTLQTSEGETIKVETLGKPYGQSGKRQPRMDLNISVPENRRFNFQIRTMNGNITLRNIDAIKNISLETANGKISIKNVLGDVKGSTSNGAIQVYNLNGSADLTTSQGNMEAMDITRSLRLSTQVGNLSVVRALGEVDISTKNGNIYINEVKMSLKAESLNGSVKASSSEIGGDWNIYSAVGEMNLNLPDDGNYEMKGSISYGEIQSTMPALTMDNKTITGIVGTGEHSISIEGNSDLVVNKY